MNSHHETPVITRPAATETASQDLAEAPRRADPELALSRAQARDRHWREVRSRRLQRCIDAFAQVEWLGYAITAPVVLWTTPLLFLAFCGGYYYSGYRVWDALSQGSCLTIVVASGISLLGWAIRGLGGGLRKLSLHWGDDQAIEVRDPGEPGE